MVPGFAFFWTLLRVDPVPKSYSYAVSMWITSAEVIGDVVGLPFLAAQLIQLIREDEHEAALIDAHLDALPDPHPPVFHDHGPFGAHSAASGP